MQRFMLPASAGLLEVLADVPDPRARRGVRHGLSGIVAVAICAVLAGSRSFTAIAQWTAELQAADLARLGLMRPATPQESTFRRVLSRLRWAMEQSMLSTLAAKYRRPPWVMRERYRTTVVTPHGKRRCFEATHRAPSGAVFTARFGGIPLRRREHARLIDGAWTTRRGRQLIARLTAGICELCDSCDGITVHHVKRLTDLNRYSSTTAPAWVQAMRVSRRKTLIVCAHCHHGIHQQSNTQ